LGFYVLKCTIWLATQTICFQNDEFKIKTLRKKRENTMKESAEVPEAKARLITSNKTRSYFAARWKQGDQIGRIFAL
jgi:hypothetical protein